MAQLGGPPPRPPREAGFSAPPGFPAGTGLPPEPSSPPTPPIPREADWTPKYPFGVPHGWELPSTSPHSPPETVIRRRQTKHSAQKAGYVYRNVGERTGYSEQLGGTGWIYAPITSHISRFLWTDASLNPELAEYGLMGGASQLQVIFKGANYEGEDDEYVFYFTDRHEGLQIANELAMATHPYADVLLPKVIYAGIPYFRLAQG